jgi:hypothetical protein
MSWKVLGLLTLLTLAQARIDLEEDSDLTGCSVQLDGYFFNLADLARYDNETDSEGPNIDY